MGPDLADRAPARIEQLQGDLHGAVGHQANRFQDLLHLRVGIGRALDQSAQQPQRL